MSDFSSDYARLRDVTLHYVSAGAGEPVVLLHGWPQTWYMWRKIIPTLAENYRVIAPDLRGLGQSSRPEAGYDKKRSQRISLILFMTTWDWGLYI